jgi:hypothetical protein
VTEVLTGRCRSHARGEPVALGGTDLLGAVAARDLEAEQLGRHAGHEGVEVVAAEARVVALVRDLGDAADQRGLDAEAAELAVVDQRAFDEVGDVDVGRRQQVAVAAAGVDVSWLGV